MGSIARFIIRTSSFVIKELIEILRQTRLLLTLVLGPFLILALFGVGYRNQARVLRTVFVIPAGQQAIANQVKQYATSLGQQLQFEGIVPTESQGLAELNNNQVDAVVVIPNNIDQQIRDNQQPVIKVYNREIDPLQVSYVKYLAQIYVDELNRRVLTNLATQAQTQAGSVEGDIQTAKASAHAMQLAYASGNATTAQQSQQQMMQSLDAVNLGIGASLGLLQGLEGTIGPNQGAGENTFATELQSLLQDINGNSSSLQKTPADQSNYAAKAKQAAKIEQDLNNLDTQIKTFRSIDPRILVNPFTAKAISINNLSLSSSQFYTPGVIALLLQHLLISFAALSIIREQTSGAMELFRVAPISSFETLLGKYISYMIIGSLLLSAITALVVFALGVPMLGTWKNYAFVMLALLFAALGVGFVLSMLSKTTSQAVQYSMLVLLFSIFFSGFFLDLRLLWSYIRFIAYIIPATYAMNLLQSIMFRGSAIDPLLFGGLLGIGVFFFILSWFMLSRRMRLR